MARSTPWPKMAYERGIDNEKERTIEAGGGREMDRIEDPGAGLGGGNTVVAKDPLVHTHHEDRPRDPRLDDPKRTLNGPRLPHRSLDLVCNVHTHDVERGHHRHGPQQ